MIMDTNTIKLHKPLLKIIRQLHTVFVSVKWVKILQRKGIYFQW